VVVVVVGVVFGMSTSCVLWAGSSGRILLDVVEESVTMGVALLGVPYVW
jgi:hypothetical protein